MKNTQRNYEACESLISSVNCSCSSRGERVYGSDLLDLVQDVERIHGKMEDIDIAQAVIDGTEQWLDSAIDNVETCEGWTDEEKAGEVRSLEAQRPSFIRRKEIEILLGAIGEMV